MAHRRSLRSLAGVAVAASFVLLVAGCGDSDPEGTGSSTTSTSSATPASSSTSTPGVSTTGTILPSSDTTATSSTVGSGGPTPAILEQIAVVLAAAFPGADYVTEIGASDTVVYYGFTESGERRATPQGALASNGGEVASDGVLITNLRAGTRVESPFEINGRGRGFEATLDVVAVSPDGVVLASTFAMGGAFEALESFAAELDTGTYEGPVYVVVASSTGLDAALTDFALVLVNVRPGVTETPFLDETAAVVRVAADDVLNVRIDPNASSPIVGELAPDATDVTVLSRPDGLTGWWLVEGPDGTVGWASSSFLVLERDFGPTEEASLLALADDFTSAVVPFQSGAVAALPWSTRFGTVWIGWPGADLERISANGLRSGTSDVWTSPRQWSISPQFDPAFEDVPLTEFLRPLALSDPDRGVEIDAPFVYGVLDTPITRNLHSVAIFDPDIDGGFFRTVRLHVDFSGGSAEIVAVTVEHWDP